MVKWNQVSVVLLVDGFDAHGMGRISSGAVQRNNNKERKKGRNDSRTHQGLRLFKFLAVSVICAIEINTIVSIHHLNDLDTFSLDFPRLKD